MNSSEKATGPSKPDEFLALYRQGDRVLEWGKVYLRPDEWDEKYFPHVLK